MDQRQFFLRDILTVLFKYKSIIMLLPILVFLAVFLGNSVWPPTYESSTKVRLVRGREVSQADTTVTRGAPNVNTVTMGIEDINSEIELIRSHDLIRNVVNSMSLHENPAFPYGSSNAQKPVYYARQTLDKILETLRLRVPPDPIERAMAQLEESIISEVIRDSWILHISCRLGDAELAQQVLTTVLDEHKKLHVEVFRNRETEQFFTTQKERIRDALDTAQDDLDSFRKANNISLLSSEKQLLLDQDADARKILIQLSQSESALAVSDSDASLIASLSSETESTVVREMQLRLYELLLEQARVTQSLGPKHPTVLSLQEQIRNAQGRVVEAIATTKRITEASLQNIQTRLVQLNPLETELNNYEQEVKRLSTDFEYYAQKVEESIVADKMAEYQVANVKNVSKPTLPREPIRPNKILNLILGLVGGLITALALAFFFDYLDHGLKTPEDIEHYLAIPTLASFFNKSGQALAAPVAHRLAVMILDSTDATKQSTITQVTSAVAREGADEVAQAIASALSVDPDGKTLLIDLVGEVSKYSGPRPGLTDVLLDQAKFEDVLGGSDDITIIGVGTQGDTNTFLWSSDRMQRLVEKLRGKFKHIILLARPVLQSHEAPKLAEYADHIVLTIKADATRREVVERSLEILKDSKSKILGAVLTERTQTIPQAVYRRI